MRLIVKGRQPKTGTEIQAATTTNLESPDYARTAFDQLDKGVVRRALCEEQGFLCAFCMRRIDPGALHRGTPTTKIAHLSPVAKTPALALTWKNLVASCDGGQRSGGRYRTCDEAQQDAVLKANPTDALAVNSLHYERRGPGLFISSSIPEVRHEVDQPAEGRPSLPGRRRPRRGSGPESPAASAGPAGHG